MTSKLNRERPKQFRAFRKSLKRYFSAYGGWSAIFGSPLFWIAAAITGISYSLWWTEAWVSVSQSLLPGLLGFSLGTYAILFSLITNRLKKTLRDLKITSGFSYLDMVNATFFHFIFVQVIALLWAFIFSGSALHDIFHLDIVQNWLSLDIFYVLQKTGSCIGFFLLIYSLTLVVGSALAVYRLAGIVDPSEE